MFMLKIDTSGAAFSGSQISTFGISTEIADILKGVARSIEQDQPFVSNVTTFDHKLYDSNGMHCGDLTYRRHND